MQGDCLAQTRVKSIMAVKVPFRLPGMETFPVGALNSLTARFMQTYLHFAEANDPAKHRQACDVHPAKLVDCTRACFTWVMACILACMPINSLLKEFCNVIMSPHILHAWQSSSRQHCATRSNFHHLTWDIHCTNCFCCGMALQSMETCVESCMHVNALLQNH